MLVDGAGAGAGAVVLLEGAGAGAGFVEPELEPPVLPALPVLVEPPALDEPPALLVVLPEPLEDALGAADEPEAPLPALWFEPAPVVPVELLPVPVPVEVPEVLPVVPEVVAPGAAVVAPAAKPAALKPPVLVLAEAPTE